MRILIIPHLLVLSQGYSVNTVDGTGSSRVLSYYLTIYNERRSQLPPGVAQKRKRAGELPQKIRELHLRHSQDSCSQTWKQYPRDLDRGPQKLVSFKAEGAQLRLAGTQLRQDHHLCMRATGKTLWVLHHQREYDLLQRAKGHLCLDQPRDIRKSCQDLSAKHGGRRVCYDTQHHYVLQVMAEVGFCLPLWGQETWWLVEAVLAESGQSTTWVQAKIALERFHGRSQELSPVHARRFCIQSLLGQQPASPRSNTAHGKSVQPRSKVPWKVGVKVSDEHVQQATSSLAQLPILGVVAEDQEQNREPQHRSNLLRQKCRRMLRELLT